MAMTTQRTRSTGRTGGAEEPEATRERLHETARQAGVDRAVLERLAASGTTAAGRRGTRAAASGLGELARSHDAEIDHDDPAAVIAWSARRLDELLDRFDGRYPAALAALHAGEEAVRRSGGAAPTAETRAFVRSVLGDDGEDEPLVRVRDRRTGAAVTRSLGADGTRSVASRRYNVDFPPERQIQNWTCSIRTATWMVRSIGIEITAAEMQDKMVPGVVGDPIGLLDATGRGMARFLRDEFGLDVSFDGAVSWEEAQALSRPGRPVGLGGRGWNHWSALRRFDEQGNARLANPSPGWMDVDDLMTRGDFDRLGVFSAVWVTLPGPELRLRVANTGGEGARLREGPSVTAAVLRTLPEGAVVEAEADSLAWRAVRTEGGQSGWVAAQFLQPDGPRYRIVTDGEGLWLREQPSRTGPKVTLLGDGTLLQGEDLAWRPVRAEGVKGWMANAFLAAVRSLSFPVG
jgi:hypothetical protein